MLKKITVVALTLAFVTSAGAQGIMERAESPECRRWVDSVYNTLTERQRVAQMVFPKVIPAQGEKTKALLRRYVQTNGVGGLLFTSATLPQYIEMANYAQSISKVPLMMTFDGEWGLAMRIADTQKFPCNMALGAMGDTALMYEYGHEVGRQMRLVGHHVDYAPVLDVNSNPNNPVIGYRSFGEDPARVEALGTAFSRGLEAAGVQAVGKHFPGHGDTSTDSHKQQTVVKHSAEVMEQVDLLPYVGFIENGLSGIMTGHIVVPALDHSGRPATLSRKITTDLLRNRMGFRGLIHTDALSMKGAEYKNTNPAVEAAWAGADVLESSRTPMEDIDLIMQAVASGRISRAEIEEHCKRILSYKYALGLNEYHPIEPEGITDSLHTPECEALMSRLAAASMTALWNRGDLLPLGNLDSRSIAVVNIGDVADNNFAEICRRYARVDVYAAPDNHLSAAQVEAIGKHDVVIAAVYGDNAQCRHTYGQLADMPHLVGVFMMTPYKMSKFKKALEKTQAVILGYDNLPEMRAAAAMAVFGGINVSGTLPVNLPGVAKIGTGVKIAKSRLGYAPLAAEGIDPALSDSVDSIIGRAIAAGAFPGCQLLVARNGNVVLERAYGLTTKGGEPVTLSTVYDLASVSKATGTLPGVMKAYDLGLVDLDAPAATYIPGLRGTGKDSITVRQLLYHESGMPASLNMFDVMIDTATYSGRLISPRRDAGHTVRIMEGAWGPASGRVRSDIVSAVRSDSTPYEAASGMWVGQAAFDTIMGRIYNIPLRKNRRYNYSCLNFCLLMDMEQRVTGIPHDRFVTDSIWAPLGAYGACYRPTLCHEQSEIAPTEKDTYLRKQLIRGYVHDETAAMLGGVSGNAGVFASAGDLAKLCQMWLDGGTYGGRRVLSENTVRLFTESKSPTCRRGLGFDKPDKDNPDYSPTCDEAGANVYGHLGFTGTVFWVDPDQDLIFIFLNNRVNPTRDNAAFNNANIRPELFRQVYKALRD